MLRIRVRRLRELKNWFEVKNMAKMKTIDWIAFVLLVVGGINWGLVAWLNFNLVDFVSVWGWLGKLLYTAVALSAVYALFTINKK